MKPNERGAAALSALEGHDAFVARHIDLPADAEAAMLRDIGFASRAALMDAVVPASIRLAEALPLPPPCSEAEALDRLRQLAGGNRVLKSFIGQGYYGTETPGVVLRNVLRLVLNPSRSGANLSRGKFPWYRERDATRR